MNLLPNEVICSIYQSLNPRDQTRLSMVSKILFDCMPNWKHSHQKLFTKCINQINEYKYGIIDGRNNRPGIKLKFDEHIRIYINNFMHIIINDPTSVSWIIINGKIKFYYMQTSRNYDCGTIWFADGLYIEIYDYDENNEQIDKISLLLDRDKCIKFTNRDYSRIFDCKKETNS